MRLYYFYNGNHYIPKMEYSNWNGQDGYNIALPPWSLFLNKQDFYTETAPHPQMYTQSHFPCCNSSIKLLSV